MDGFSEQQVTKSKVITIDPITRLEGHGKIEIFLDDAGNVKDTYFQVVELRGFERFCQGRPAEEMARITPRICGVCPGSHHMASTKALDNVFNVDPPAPAKKLRELFLYYREEEMKPEGVMKKAKLILDCFEIK